MRWISSSRRDAATVASVLLSVAIGVIGNYLVADWYWALAAFLVVLMVCLAGLEVIRRRIDRLDRNAAIRKFEPDHQYLIDNALVALRAHLRVVAAGSPGGQGDDTGALVAARLQATPSGAPAVLSLALRPDDEAGGRDVSSALGELLRTDPTFAAELASRMPHPPAGTVTVTGDDWHMRGSVIAGGNVDQSRRTIRIGGAGVLAVALLLGSGVIGAGRISGGAPEQQGVPVAPPAAAPTTSPPRTDKTTPDVPPASNDGGPRPYESFTVFASGTGGNDFDPNTVTKGLDDVAYHRQSGLTTLNNAGVAPLPSGKQFSNDECGKVPQGSWLSSIEPRDVRVGLQLCLITSDGRLGSLLVDDIQASAQVLSVSFKLWL